MALAALGKSTSVWLAEPAVDTPKFHRATAALLLVQLQHLVGHSYYRQQLCGEWTVSTILDRGMKSAMQQDDGMSIF